MFKLISIAELAEVPDKMIIGDIKLLTQYFSFEFYKRYADQKKYTINFTKKVSVHNS